MADSQYYRELHRVSADDLVVTRELDARGLSCPLPLLKAKQEINRLEPGDILKVLCTDPGSVRDFEVFSRQSGHELLDSDERDGTYVYWLRKKG